MTSSSSSSSSTSSRCYGEEQDDHGVAIVYIGSPLNKRQDGEISDQDDDNTDIVHSYDSFFGLPLDHETEAPCSCFTTDVYLGSRSTAVTSSCLTFFPVPTTEQEQQQQQGKCHCHCHHRHRQRRVKFGMIDLIEFSMHIGDHPECKVGPAVQLSSNVQRRREYRVAEYELIKPRRRSRRELYLSVMDRTRIVRRTISYDVSGSSSCSNSSTGSSKRRTSITFANLLNGVHQQSCLTPRYATTEPMLMTTPTTHQMPSSTPQDEEEENEEGGRSKAQEHSLLVLPSSTTKMETTSSTTPPPPSNPNESSSTIPPMSMRRRPSIIPDDITPTTATTSRGLVLYSRKSLNRPRRFRSEPIITANGGSTTTPFPQPPPPRRLSMTMMTMNNDDDLFQVQGSSTTARRNSPVDGVAPQSNTSPTWRQPRKTRKASIELTNIQRQVLTVTGAQLQQEEEEVVNRSPLLPLSCRLENRDARFQKLMTRMSALDEKTYQRRSQRNARRQEFQKQRNVWKLMSSVATSFQAVVS